MRDYQLDVVHHVENEIAAGRRPCMVAPTGSGKTVIAAELSQKATARGEPVVFIVHRRELTDQTSQKLDAVGIDHGIVQAGFLASPAAYAKAMAKQRAGS